jgi:hypothetical protein
MTGRANVVAEMWLDPDFQALSPAGKCLWLYMLSGPHMRMSAGGICALPWDHLKKEIGRQFHRTGDQVKQAMIEVVEAGFVSYDSRCGVMLILNWLKYNKPQSPKNISGWAATVKQLPECALINDWLRLLGGHCIQRGPSFVDVWECKFKHLMIPDERLDRIANGDSEPQTLFKVAPAAESSSLPAWAIDMAKRLERGMRSPRTFRTRDYERWAESIEKIQRLDGHSKEDIAYVVDWIRGDEFWSGVILSGQNLRKHFDRLLDGAHNGRREQASADPFAAFKEGANDRT